MPKGGGVAINGVGALAVLAGSFLAVHFDELEADLVFRAGRGGPGPDAQQSQERGGSAEGIHRNVFA